MTPDISEFTYGFALTNELVGWTALSSVPIFPSLIEEGKADGGYDVRLDRTGVPLYLQFKRSHVMKRSSAHEIKNLALGLSRPFYRFAITERKRSLQHTSLVMLDNGVNEVYYAAPRFHTMAAINAAWTAHRIAQRSIFVTPSDIGLIADDLRHTVSFDANNAYFCSNPVEIVPYDIEQLRFRIIEKLEVDPRPLGEKLSEWLDDATRAARQARMVQSELDNKRGWRLEDIQSDVIAVEAQTLPRPSRIRPITERMPPMDLRAPRDLSEHANKLRLLADTAQTEFNAQLVIVQPT